MTDWSPEESDKADEPAEAVVRIITASPVALRLVPTPHSRQPEGHTVFRTLGALDGNLTDSSPVLAQGSLPTATFEAVLSQELFRDPVPLLLTAQADGDGLRATLAAIVSTESMQRIERAQRAADEPWLASLEEEPRVGDSLAEEQQAVPFLLGVVLRFPEDRKFPSDLEHEAVDLLGTLLSGGAMDADRKRVENLLKSL
ncbi:MAG: hypothetical protein ABIT38_00035 [Gemmatimonadaceae bacterium]